MRFIDSLLNRITMYRLMLYYLFALLIAAAILGAFGLLPYSPIAIALSAAVITLACWLANRLFAWAFHAHTNSESFFITACILALIITPPAIFAHGAFDFGALLAGLPFLIWAAVFAMASKYLLAIHKKHIFNPAALSVALTALVLGQYASWWVGGNLPMLPFVVIGGLLVARKLQRFDLVLAFTVGAVASIIVTNPLLDPATSITKAFLHTSLLFFAFVMITEPLTTPPRRARRIVYGAFVGLLFSPAVHLGSIYSTPELALLAGNVLSFALSPKAKYILQLKEKNEIGTDVDEFVFAFQPAAGVQKNRQKINFRPGQYMEWTLGHVRTDARGNRRYFTIASSPTESDVRLGIKFYGGPDGVKSSSFKLALAALRPGDAIMAGQLAGDFTLPNDSHKKLAFIAGGIGVTPFRSMAKYLSDTAGERGAGAGGAAAGHGAHRSVTLLYAVRTPAEICYREIFDEAAQKIGMKTVYVAASAGERIDPTLIAKQIPDYLERLFYLSGSRSMVTSFEDALARMGVPRNQIRTDFFPGFA